MRRWLAHRKLLTCKNVWPIDLRSDTIPHGWPGWPGGKKFALVLLHDVETGLGQQKCSQLMDLEEGLGFRSSFNFVPEDYPVDAALREEIVRRGFEVAVHGLKHDGKLFLSRRTFIQRAVKINHYLKEWHARGFSSPSMHHRLDWMNQLHIEYDISTFDTDPFEPQADGVGTIFPFMVASSNGASYYELPHTLPQDFTLFVLLQNESIDIWKKKLDWIVKNGGMALLNTHPDYMRFEAGATPYQYPVALYRDFLTHVKSNFEGAYWNARPLDVARYLSKASFGSGRGAHGLNRPSQSKHKKEGKVCIIAKYVYPHDTRLFQQVKVLQQNNVSVDVICMFTEGQEALYRSGALAVHRILFKNLKKDSFIKYLYTTGIFAVAAFATIVSLSLKADYRVVVIHTLPEFLVFVGFLHKLLGKTIILDGRDITVELLSSRWQSKKVKAITFIARQIEKACIGFSDEVITASSGFKRSLMERKVPDSKITVLINTADQDIFRFDTHRTFQRIERNAKLVYHGTVSTRFGIVTAVEAMAILQKKIPGSELHIYGYYDVSYKDMLENRAKELSVKDFIFLHESKPLEEIYKIIIATDLGIVPYISDKFMNLALSTKTFEYIASGLAVVASRLNSIEELFHDDSISYCEPGNPIDLAEKIETLCLNPELRKQKRDCAFKEFTRYSEKAVSDRYYRLIQKHL